MAELRFRGADQVALVQLKGKLIRWNRTGVTKFFDHDALKTERGGVVLDRSDRNVGAHPITAEETLDRRIAAAQAARESNAWAPISIDELDSATRQQLEALGYMD